MAFESVDVCGPKLTEGRKPLIDLLKLFGFQPVDAALSVHRGFHDAGLAQHTQMFGDSRLRQTELSLDISDGLFGGDEETQYRAAVRLRDDLEYRSHAPNMPHKAYTSQGIYIHSLHRWF